MNKKVLGILALCLKAKEKGHDVFFHYMAHINQIEITVYEDGWRSADFNEDGKVIETYESEKMNFYTDGKLCSHAIDEVEEYLRELV